MIAVAKIEEKSVTRTVSNTKGVVKHDMEFKAIIDNSRKPFMDMFCGMFSNSLGIEDIEDIFQESCCIAWKKWNTPGFNRSEKGLKGLLFTICRNIIGHEIRKRKFNTNIDELLQRLDNDDNCERERFDIDEKDNSTERFRLLHEAINSLSETDKDIIYFYYWEKMKMDEIASTIGYRSAASVKSKKCNCLKKIKEMMRSAA